MTRTLIIPLHQNSRSELVEIVQSYTGGCLPADVLVRVPCSVARWASGDAMLRLNAGQVIDGGQLYTDILGFSVELQDENPDAVQIVLGQDAAQTVCGNPDRPLREVSIPIAEHTRIAVFDAIELCRAMYGQPVSMSVPCRVLDWVDTATRRRVLAGEVAWSIAGLPTTIHHAGDYIRFVIGDVARPVVQEAVAAPTPAVERYRRIEL